MDNSIIDDVFNEEKKEKKVDYKAYFVWISLLLVATLFKIQHWPFGSLFTLLAYAGIMSYSIVAFLLYKDIKRVNFIMLGLSLIYVCRNIYSFLSNDNKEFNTFWLYSYLSALAVICLIYFVIYRFKKPAPSNL